MADVRSDRSYTSSKTDGSIAGHNVRFWTSAMDPAAIRCFSRLLIVVPAEPVVDIVELPDITNEAAFQPERASTAIIFHKPRSPARPPLRNESNKASARPRRVAKPPVNRVDPVPSVTRVDPLPPVMPAEAIPSPPPPVAVTDKESCASFRTTATSIADTLFSGTSPKRPRTYRSRLYSQFKMSSQAPSFKAPAPPVQKRPSPVTDRYSFVDSPAPKVPVSRTNKSVVHPLVAPSEKEQTIAQRLALRKRGRTPAVNPRKVSDKRSSYSVVVETSKKQPPSKKPRSNLAVQKVSSPKVAPRVAALREKGRATHQPNPEVLEPEVVPAKKTPVINESCVADQPSSEVAAPEVAPAKKTSIVKESRVVPEGVDENSTQTTASVQKQIHHLQTESEHASVASGIIKSLTDLLIEKEKYETEMGSHFTKLQQSTTLILQCSSANSDLSKRIRTVTRSLQENELNSRSR